MKIHIGVFAHNEQKGIASVLCDLARQDLFSRTDVSVRVVVLANGGFSERRAVLRAAAQDERWLGSVLRSALPRWPSGFVLVHFLVKRLHGLWSRRGAGAGRAILLAAVGFIFDLLVYVNAQLQNGAWQGRRLLVAVAGLGE